MTLRKVRLCWIRSMGYTMRLRLKSNVGETHTEEGEVVFGQVYGLGFGL